MEKEKEIKTMVPTLRFPEFREQTGWEVEFLSNILAYERPDNFIVETETYGEEGIPVLTANKSFILGYTRESTGIYVNLPVIIFDDFTTDKKYVDFPFKVKSSAIKILHTKHTDILRFIYELMNQITFEAKEHKRYYISTYQRIQVPLPKEEEQQKIADCLSSLDDLIEATAQKVKTLKEHKKGLMQRLFPAEGKNVPDLRFLEFQGAEEWKESSLDEYFDFKQGFQCPVEEQYDKQEHGMVRFIRIIDLTQPSTPYRYINDPGNQYYINKENLFMVRYGDPGLVGIGYEGIIANNLFQLIPKKKINPYFFYFLFSKEKTRIKGLSSSTSLSAINFTSLKAFKIVVSQNTDEQQKIADCFSSIDELIEVISRKVEILKEHKKGLMQQLFPKI